MTTEQQADTVWKAGLYLRLSQEDEGEAESSSIATQRALLTEYAARSGLPVVDVYTDDGYSGTSFDRPGFQRMLRDIEAERINCVITKDFSRFGRNASETMEFMDKWFPRHGTRYISVTDGLDTGKRSPGMTASLMSTINELYARDISQKIKSALTIKMKQGKYISPFAPYGYRKDPNDKNRLLKDPAAATVVQEIFRRAANGEKTSTIAEDLNARGILTPSQYRNTNGAGIGAQSYGRRTEWTAGGICKLLRNEVYLGKLLQGKTEKLSFKEKTSIARKRESWIVVEGTHEPLVSQALFQLARTRCSSRRCLETKGFENVFSGVAFCAACGKQMSPVKTRKRNGTYDLVCGGYKAHGTCACSNHFIDHDSLCEAVLSVLGPCLTLTPEEKERLLAQLLRRDEKEKRRQTMGQEAEALARAQRRKQSVAELTRRLFEEHCLGIVEEAAYCGLMEQYAAELAGLEQRIALLKAALQAPADGGICRQRFSALLEEAAAPKKLTKALLQRLVERIEVEQGAWTRDACGKRIKRQRVHIYLKCACEGNLGRQ